MKTAYLSRPMMLARELAHVLHRKTSSPPCDLKKSELIKPVRSRLTTLTK